MSNRRIFILIFILHIVIIIGPFGLVTRDTFAAEKGPFTLKQVISYPYPSNIITSPTGSRVAWVFNEQGIRNIWVAEGPDFKARRLTENNADDGQELTNL